MQTTKNMSEDSELLLLAIKQTGERYGLTMPITVLVGSKIKKVTEVSFDKLPIFGKGKHHSIDWWKELGNILIINEFLDELVSDHKVSYTVTHKGLTFLLQRAESKIPGIMSSISQEISCIFPLTREMLLCEDEKIANFDQFAKNRKTTKTLISELSGNEKELYDLLLELRKKESEKQAIAPYMIFDMKVLQTLATDRPIDLDHFRTIEGIDESKVPVYGPVFTSLIADFCVQRKIPYNLDSGAILAVHDLKETELSTNSSSNKFDKTPKVTGTVQQVYDLFQKHNKTIEEVALLRQIQVATVQGYLATAARNGWPLDWKRAGMDDEIFGEILQLSSRINSNSLKDLRQNLPPSVSWGILKLAIAKIITDEKRSNDMEFIQQLVADDTLSNPTSSELSDLKRSNEGVGDCESQNMKKTKLGTQTDKLRTAKVLIFGRSSNSNPTIKKTNVPLSQLSQLSTGQGKPTDATPKPSLVRSGSVKRPNQLLDPDEDDICAFSQSLSTPMPNMPTNSSQVTMNSQKEEENDDILITVVSEPPSNLYNVEMEQILLWMTGRADGVSKEELITSFPLWQKHVMETIFDSLIENFLIYESGNRYFVL